MGDKTILTVLALALVGCQESTSPTVEVTPAGATAELPAGAARAAETIHADALRNHVARLSDDAMAGRGPGSAGGEEARRYLAQALEELGLQPAFGGDWEQRFEMLAITSEAPPAWSFSTAGGDLELTSWDDYIASSGVQEETARVDGAELVFVGYGIQAPEFDWDDFKGVDLKGKMLLMMNNDPDWDESLFEGERRLYYGRWDYKYESAAKQGAAGAIILHTTPSAGYPWQVVQTSWTGPQFELPAGDEPRLQIAAWVTEEAARRLLTLAGHELNQLLEAARGRDFEPVALGVSTSLELTNSLRTAQGANVGGLLEGSDPERREEVVVYTAHYDHLGVGEPDEHGDDIYNGALDNASGCAALLTLAEAFTSLPSPPPRSLLFLFVDAEEQGLLGSQYFAENPTIPPGRIAANLNIDGANIWGRTLDVGYIGHGKSTLDAVVDQAARRQNRTVKPEQFPDRGYFYRSDQFNFAKIGVPAIYLDNGVEFIGRPEGWGQQQIEAWEAERYHQPSDELDESWNLEGFVEDTLLMFEAGLAIASSEELPRWNPGDEFESARLQALAAQE